MGKLLNGKTLAKKIHQKTARQVKKLKRKGITPKLAVILVGKDKPSQTYVRNKQQAAKKVGIDFQLVKLPAKTTKKEIISKINDVQSDPKLTGIIVQLPLPNPEYTTDVLNSIKPELDVDCLTETNFKKLKSGKSKIIPPTPGAIMAILQDLKVNLKGKNVTILGKGMLVGKPLAIIMKNKGANVIVCDSKTVDTKEKCLKADIIVSAVGKKDLVRSDMIKKGAIIIDAGVSFENGKMYGDVNIKEALEKASFVTPTPGGVGPMTVAMLLWNTLHSSL